MSHTNSSKCIMALTQQAYKEKPTIKPKAYNFNIANALNKSLVSW